MTTTQAMAQPCKQEALQWNVAATLPDENGYPSLGYAGMVGGISNNVLLVGGGANFPNALPWNGGKKFYADKLYVLQKNNDHFEWASQVFKLPEPIGYAGCATAAKGVVYAGGDNSNGISPKAFILTWDENAKKVSASRLPDLPIAVTAPAATAIENMVYVACGDAAKQSSNQFFCINIADTSPQWQALPNAPKALANASLVAQGDKLFLMGGRTKTPTGISELHSTVYCFDVKKNRWKQVADIFDGEKNTPFTATAAFAIGKHEILLAGGDKGDVFHKIEMLLANAAAAKSDEEKATIIKEKNFIVEHHPGFSTDMLLYNIAKNKWAKIGAMPYAAQVTTLAAVWGKDMMIVSGEVRPGVRSAKIIAAHP